MTLQKEIFITLLIAVGLFTGLDSLIQRLIVFPTFKEADRSLAIKDMARSVAALDREIYHLKVLTKDWAAWDDSYNFIKDRNKDYIESNLVKSSFTDNSLNAIFLINDNNEVVWGKSFDLEEEKDVRIDMLPEKVFPTDSPFVNHRNPDDFLAGLVLTDHGPMLIVSLPIVTSENQGPIRGSLIMARFLNDELVETIRSQTGVKLEIWSCTCEEVHSHFSLPCGNKDCAITGDDRIGKDEYGALLKADFDNQPVIVETDEDRLFSYAIYKDIFGNNSLMLRVEKPMETTAIGRSALNSSLLSIVVIGFLILVILLEALKRSVLKPIKLLTRHAVAVREDKDHKTHISSMIASDNEFGVLAREFDTMVARLSSARQQVVEQSYYAGMTEMASGVMHNIRNALNPLISDIEMLREEFRHLPLEQMEKTREELENEELVTERGKMLADFINESMAHVCSMVEVASERLDGVNDRIGVIEKIINDQEQYASSERSREEIDLLSLAEEALSLLDREYYNHFEVVLEPSLGEVGVVFGHRHAILHVFTNLLNNAAEAILRSGIKEGKIVISAEKKVIEGRNFLHVKIKDNGSGIRKEDLQRIFERGFTTKNSETSGIGLHWCANTIATVQGRLYAESKGEKRGATMHVLVPQR